MADGRRPMGQVAIRRGRWRVMPLRIASTSAAADRRCGSPLRIAAADRRCGSPRLLPLRIVAGIASTSAAADRRCGSWPPAALHAHAHPWR